MSMIRFVLFSCIFPALVQAWVPSNGRSEPRSSLHQSLTDDASQRWTGSGRWESAEAGTGGEQFLLKEKFGTYFKVPNPATLMTKIICTIGPSTADPEILGRMMDAGMSAARINLSHGSHEYAAEIIDNVRTAAANRHKLCPIILDTKGPEIRVSWLPTKTLTLNCGEDVVLLTGKHSEKSPVKPVKGQPTDHHQVAVTYPYLAKAVRQGDVVLLDDGRISLMVTRIQSEDAVHTTSLKVDC